jgi:hypothetical protein
MAGSWRTRGQRAAYRRRRYRAGSRRSGRSAPRHPRTSPSAGSRPLHPQPRGVAARDSSAASRDVGAGPACARAAPPGGSAGCSPIRSRGRAPCRKGPTQRDFHQRFGIGPGSSTASEISNSCFQKARDPMMRETGTRAARRVMASPAPAHASALGARRRLSPAPSREPPRIALRVGHTGLGKRRRAASCGVTSCPSPPVARPAHRRSARRSPRRDRPASRPTAGRASG